MLSKIADTSMILIKSSESDNIFKDTVLDIYELLPGFLIGLIVIVVVSLLTKAPEKEITDVYDDIKAN